MNLHRLARFWALFVTATLFSSCSGGPDREGGGDFGAFASLELEASYPEPFSYLSSVRELSDGTLMAADPLSQVLLTLDIVAGTADTVGGVGGGPGEYRQPDEVFPLPGDSTLLVDFGKAALTVVGPDGTLHEGMPMARPGEGGRLNLLMPRWLDGQGRIYFQGGQGGLGTGGPLDSIPVVRFDRTLEQYDTVAVAYAPEPRINRSGGNVRVMPRMMEGRDDWAIGADGRVAVIRTNGYSVDWFHPDGRVVVGPANPVEPHGVTDADKEAALESLSSGGAVLITSTGGSGGGTVSMRRGMSMGGEGPGIDEFEWAETFPPFQPDRARVSDSGEVWVERWLPVDEEPRWEVFDSEGARVGFVVAPFSSQLLGFGTTQDGAEAAYLVRTDDVGLMWLERYRVRRREG